MLERTAMEAVFYYAPQSRAVPVAIALTELDVPHRRVTLDMAAREQKGAAFLALNPNGLVPTLVVDGTPMFESCAILQWLGDMYGVDANLWPSLKSPERLRALSWSTWAYVTYGSALHRLFLAAASDEGGSLRHPALADHSRSELAHMLGLLNSELERHPYLMGEAFSLVDLTVCSIVLWSRMVDVPTASFKHVETWLAACTERPSFKSEWA
jgi:glutathione S-transferase